MKSSNFIVRIPEPCHEDWNAMQPDAKGKFCNSCSKSVFDFSNKTDTEIRDILIEYKDQKVCGHFKKTQIDRPLNIQINLNDLPRNVSITKVFAIALFIVFGTFLFSCTNNQGQKIGEIEVVETKNVLTLGNLMLDPLPIENEVISTCDVISGDTIMKLDSVASTNYIESTVEGGIRFEEVAYVEEIPVVEEQPIIEPMMVGQMIVDYIEPNDTTVITSVDSIASKESENVLNNDVIGTSTVLSIYPNPGNGEFTIKYDVLKRADVLIHIFDMKGVLVKSVVNIPQQYEGKYLISVNLNELPNGLYNVCLTNNGKKTTERLVIER